MSTLPAPVRRPGAVLPTVAEVRAAARDTGMLLKLRWRIVRSARSKAVVGVGIGVFVAALFIASQVGTLFRAYAEEGVETAAGAFAVNYVIALNGELGVIGASAVGSVIVVALFAPFVGSAMTSLAPTDDLSGLRPTRIHRFFDSIVTNTASGIGFLQLITLTSIGSLLTLDGGRPAGLLVMWSIWPCVLLLSVAEGWVIELAHRRYGTRVRRAIGLGLVLLIGLMVSYDPQHGKTVFGLGNLITNTVQAATEGRFDVVGLHMGVVAVVSVALFVTGLVTCRAALAHPAPVTALRAERRRLVPMSANPNRALAQILLAQIIRSPEVRRPVLTVFAMGVPAVWLGGQSNVVTTLVVAVPLAVALAFGINIFGVLGPAMSWFAAQPGLMRRILVMATVAQIAMTVLLATLIWAPVTIAGRVDLGDVGTIAAGTIVSTLLTVRSATAKSVTRPFMVRLGGRGDMIVPPLTAINYTIRFALWAGQIGVLVTTSDQWLQLALVAFAVAWTSLRFLRLFRYWNDRDVQAFVVNRVAAA